MEWCQTKFNCFQIWSRNQNKCQHHSPTGNPATSVPCSAASQVTVNLQRGRLLMTAKSFSRWYSFFFSVGVHPPRCFYFSADAFFSICFPSFSLRGVFFNISLQHPARRRAGQYCFCLFLSMYLLQPRVTLCVCVCAVAFFFYRVLFFRKKKKEKKFSTRLWSEQNPPPQKRKVKGAVEVFGLEKEIFPEFGLVLSIFFLLGFFSGPQDRFWSRPDGTALLRRWRKESLPGGGGGEKLTPTLLESSFVGFSLYFFVFFFLSLSVPESH